MLEPRPSIQALAEQEAALNVLVLGVDLADLIPQLDLLVPVIPGNMLARLTLEVLCLGVEAGGLFCESVDGVVEALEGVAEG